MMGFLVYGWVRYIGSPEYMGPEVDPAFGILPCISFLSFFLSPPLTLIAFILVNTKKTLFREVMLFYGVFLIGWTLVSLSIIFYYSNRDNRQWTVDYLNSDKSPIEYFGENHVGVWKIKMDSPDFDYCLFYVGGSTSGAVGYKNGEWVCRYLLIPREMSLFTMFRDDRNSYYDKAPYPKRLEPVESLDDLRTLAENAPFSQEDMRKLYDLVYAVWPVSERPPKFKDNFITWSSGEVLLNEFNRTKARWVRKNGPLRGVGVKDPHTPYTLLP